MGRGCGCGSLVFEVTPGTDNGSKGLDRMSMEFRQELVRGFSGDTQGVNESSFGVGVDHA